MERVVGRIDEPTRVFEMKVDEAAIGRLSGSGGSGPGGGERGSGERFGEAVEMGEAGRKPTLDVSGCVGGEFALNLLKPEEELSGCGWVRECV